MNGMGLRRIPPDQSSGSGHTFGTLRHPSIGDPILSKRVCFYKSGDPQFNGLRLVINNRTFKTFDALLDSLSKKVPLAFGVRNITTPHGIHAISSLDELEDGKSYICSDRRKVKPINLALARKKLPPWYHARPVSSRRQTVQQARLFPGRSIHKKQPAVLRSPKRLLVFCNGEPAIKQTVVLHKKITPSYESILEYISELMQFRVVKLHTPDGKRVDGLPGLILCSGTVVAAGREPFKPANYRAQKAAPARRNTRRAKSLNRKKKSLSYTSDIRTFSPSSERYIVDQIHNTIAGRSYGVPSNPTNSAELESGRMLESVAETEEDNDLSDGAEGRTCSLPNEDDIEKSFRVNQDGSMTVEMRVRLTIKEEEMVHWTTTLTRSCVASQLNSTCLSVAEPMEGICSPNSTSLDLQSSAESSNNAINKDKTRDDNDEDPPSLSNEAFSESCNEEDEIKTQTDVVFPRRAPSPGHKQISRKQASVESIKSVTANGIQEDMVGSYSFREETENGSMTEQYCVVKQSSSRPVPKPRRLGSVEHYSRNRFTSEGMSEVLQIDSSGEEVTETVLHIYEQQTCQDNFLANICVPYMSASETTFGRPATSETGRLSCSNEFEPEQCRPSTASESISIWRTESMSVASDIKSPPQKNAVKKTANAQQQLQKFTKGQVKINQGDAADQRGKHSSPVAADKDKSMKVMQTAPEPLTPANQLDMKPVLEKIYHSINSIRQITQSKRPSCLEKSNSLPDFSSHVASTFGSSSKALLAFLTVMTLKEGITGLNLNKLNANDVSCAEALKMMDSLTEIANIEDSHKLKTSLSDLQQSTSKQLLQSWKDFQELSGRRRTPQSSLSFSYDSSGVITTEPEGRVRSIREMFLARGATDIHQRRVPGFQPSEQLESRGETSVGGGYQTPVSSEPSSGEDDSARQSITRGFVRRTIEMLYGKKDVHVNEEAGERPPSAPKQRNKEHSSIFSSFQTAGSKAMSELSYFNSTNALDTLTGATRCIAFNAQVGPGDSVPIDNGRWLLGENTLIRKSVSDPVGINKTFSNDPEGEKVCQSTDEYTPYSLFSSKSELEDKPKSFSRKCTYFSLPHCSDSDAHQDEVSKGSDAVVEEKDDPGDGKACAEKNGKSVGLSDFKIVDNKVHPLAEPPPDAEVVVVQPGKGQGVVNRRLQDPDMLDILYNFCGQHCPIL
ncbi:oxygen-regulated protein 1-like [Salarias fasciatus]|uniref:oxygen-regulated protein 1-like n=1 Tax=Salarias fasciatus TaxID=181472 RepID=UPI001176D5DA|nr:oxygen-regulated protein 1 [Salarias fasciatus]